MKTKEDKYDGHCSKAFKSMFSLADI